MYLNPQPDDISIVTLHEAKERARELSSANNGAPVAVWNEKDSTVALFAGYEEFTPTKLVFGDQSILVNSEVDPTEYAVFIQFKLEEFIDSSVSPSNEVIANALCEFFDCAVSVDDIHNEIIDLYSARESRCGDWYTHRYPEIKVDEEKLKEFLISNMVHLGELA